MEFNGNFKESVQPVVTIPDTTPSAFMQLLYYIYSDEVCIMTSVQLFTTALLSF
jgi:BTB/POZ domain